MKNVINLYSTKTALNGQAKEVHDKLNPFDCERSVATFSRKTNLKRHFDVIHEKSTPVYFSRSDHLESHHEEAHEKPFKCNDCETSCSRKLFQGTMK